MSALTDSPPLGAFQPNQESFNLIIMGSTTGKLQKRKINTLVWWALCSIAHRHTHTQLQRERLSSM